jgi:YD repeat-containing protein
VIAYKAGLIDSKVHEAVFYYENDNGGNTNMAQPIDGGPGGGGILIDGGNQSTINYDANGNLTKYKGWTYSYDAQNRLINAVNGSVSAQFYYDGKNRLIARNVKGVIRFNSWDGWELLEEYSSSLNVATGYLQGTTGVIKSWSEANTLYYYQDKLGSTTHVANASGQLVESYKYDLYGTPSYFNSTSQPLNRSTPQPWRSPTSTPANAGFPSLRFTIFAIASCRRNSDAFSSQTRLDSRATRAICIGTAATIP